jgi:hypothetical protein
MLSPWYWVQSLKTSSSIALTALGLKEKDKSSLLPYRAGGEVDHVIQADFLGCEDNINHQGLNQALNQYIDDQKFSDLIHAFLTTEIRDKEEKKSYLE